MGGDIPIISDVMDAVGSVVQPISEFISDIPVVGDVWQGVTGVVSDVMSVFPEEIRPFVSFVPSIFTGGASLLADLGSAIDGLSLDSFVSGLESFLPESLGGDVLNIGGDFALDTAADTAFAGADYASSFADSALGAASDATSMLDAATESAFGAAWESGLADTAIEAADLAQEFSYDALKTMQDSQVAEWAAEVASDASTTKFLQNIGEAAGFVFDKADPTKLDITGWGYNPLTAGASAVAGPVGGVMAKGAQKLFGFDPTVSFDFTDLASMDNLKSLGITAGLAGLGGAALAGAFSPEQETKKAKVTSIAKPRGTNMKYEPVTGFANYQPLDFNAFQHPDMSLTREMKAKFGSASGVDTAASMRADLLSSLWRPLNG